MRGLVLYELVAAEDIEVNAKPDGCPGAPSLFLRFARLFFLTPGIDAARL